MIENITKEIKEIMLENGGEIIDNECIYFGNYEDYRFFLESLTEEQMFSVIDICEYFYEDDDEYLI